MRVPWIRKEKCIQLLIGVCSGIGALPQGIAVTFPSSALPQMALPDSDLKPSRDEAALFASILYYGALVATIFSGPLVDMVGRKRILIATTIPTIAGFILVATATSPWLIILGRLFIGFATGASVPAGAVYASETAEASMRGLVGGMLYMLFAVGCVIGYFLNLITPTWRILTWSSISMPLLFLFIIVPLPCSPRFLLMKGRTEQALEALRRLRKEDEEELQNEFDLMKDHVVNQTETSSMLSDIQQHKAILGRIIPLGLCFGGCGGSIIISLAELLLLHLDISLSEQFLAFGIGAFHLLGTIISMFTTDRFGRKFLLVLCGVFMTLGWASLALYSYFSPHESSSAGWLEYVPFLLMSFIVLSFAFGYRCLCIVIASEMLPLEVRSFGTSMMLLITAAGIGSFSQLILYMLDVIGLFGTSLVFASINVCGVIYCKLALVETKGKTLEVISNKKG